MSMFGNSLPGGMFGGLRPINQTLLMGGLGMLSGQNPQQQFAGAMQGYGAGSQMDLERQERAKKDKLEADKRAALQRIMANPSMKDLSPYAELFALDPDLATNVLTKRFEPKTPDYPASYEEWQLAQDNPDYAASLNQTKAPQGTDDMRELSVINEERVSKGLEPYRLDEWITTRAKAGATGLQLPAEVGARIGLGDQFAQEAPAIRAAIEEGAATGVWDRAQLAAGVGAPMEVWRRMETGKEALVRNLTGAGMAQAEAENQASRYSINPWKDRKEDMLLKLEGLLRDLEATKHGAIGARSGAFAPGATAPTGDGAIDMGDGITVRPLD